MPSTQGLTPLEAVNEIRNNNNGQVVLVLQGGGALGAYQGGVYQALHEAGVEPDWLIGTSIGAINASLIAGNKVEDRLPKLKEFWRRMQYSNFWGAFPAWTGIAEAVSSWTTLTSGIPGFFEANPRAFLGAQLPLGVDHAAGEPVWKFNLVPDPGELGAETWENPESLKHGGGSLWTPLSLDVTASIVYLPVGNPAHHRSTAKSTRH